MDQRTQIDRHRAQILLTRERQKALRQRCAALRALQGAVDEAMQPWIGGNAFAQQIEIAHHGHQQIVEVMRDAAGGPWPTASIFCAWRNCSCAFSRAATSFIRSALRCSTRCSSVAVNSASAVRSAASCSNNFSRSISAVLRAVMSEQTPTSDLMVPSGRRTTRARVFSQCCEPSGHRLRYSIL